MAVVGCRAVTFISVRLQRIFFWGGDHITFDMPVRLSVAYTTVIYPTNLPSMFASRAL